MGSVFCSAVVEGNDFEEARKAAYAYQEQQCYDYGHDTYGGHLGCVDGVTRVNLTFRDVDEAEKYATNHHDKWDPPMLLKFGPTSWLLAGWMPE